MTDRRTVVAAALALALALAGCGSSGPATHLAQLRVSSPAFGPGRAVPRIYTCDGADISPPLRWSGVPPKTTSLELVMRDPDAPGGNFIHWHLSQIPASAHGLAPGRVPPAARQGTNSFGTSGYRGPCPPPGASAHHYVITVTAQRGQRALAAGTLTGTYGR
jgi:Raf kinase inhibitor-like YbhB/YbcL family protein